MIASSLPAFHASEFLTSWDDKDLEGRGSFACVRKCEHSKLGKIVAKCFRITGSADKYKEAMKEIETEVNVLYHLDHKNIVQIYGTTRWSNNIGIIMECIDGGNLEDFLMSKDVPDIPWLLRLRFFREIADGLAYLHTYDPKKSFVHGDLKPQNILLTSDLTLKIADFGSVNTAIESSIASASTNVGSTNRHTPYYSAPEVLNSLVTKSRPSMDVYSYGMIGYEIMTRQQVFHGANYNRVIQAIIDLGQKPDVSLLRDVESSLEGNPQDLYIFRLMESIIVHCWNFEAKNRPDIRDVRNRTSKELKALTISTHWYHIDDMKPKKSRDEDKQRIIANIELKDLHFPFEEGPTPSPYLVPNLQTTDSAIRLGLDTKVKISMEGVASPTKHDLQGKEKYPLRMSPPRKMLRTEKHEQPADSDQQLSLTSAENDQSRKKQLVAENLLQQLKEVSTKQELSRDDGRQLLSLWVQVHELKDVSVTKRASEYFPTKVELSEISLQEYQVEAMSEVLKYTNKYIEWFGFCNSQLHTSSFRHFSAALMTSKSEVEGLWIYYNKLDNVDHVVDIIHKVKKRLGLMACCSDGEGGSRFVNPDERSKIQAALNELKNSSLEVRVDYSTVLRPQK